MRMPGFATVLILAALVSTPSQAEPIADARAAIAVEDYAAARAILLTPEFHRDPVALEMLADLTRDGLGGPADLAEAYMLYSMSILLALPSEVASAGRKRHEMTHDMTAAEIRQGEARVVARLDDDIGADERRARIAAFQKDLRICRRADPSCEALVEQILPYGPAAADLVPEIERLMTHDPQWIPRQLYSFALAMIGTSAVPAFCRLLLDEEELATEGTWNASLAANRLGLLGAAAADARPCLVEALARDYDEIGIANSEIVRLYEADPYEVVLDLKREIATDLVDIGDPDGKTRYSLLFYGLSEPDLKTGLLVGWSYALTYGDGAPVLAMLPKALRGQDEKAQLWALLILPDVADTERFSDVADAMKPMVQALTSSSNPDVAEAARNALEVFDKAAP